MSDRQGLAAVAVIMACCGLPALMLLAGGTLATFGSILARFWPLTVAGAAAAVWGGLRLVRLLRARNRSLREHH